MARTEHYQKEFQYQKESMPKRTWYLSTGKNIAFSYARLISWIKEYFSDVRKVWRNHCCSWRVKFSLVSTSNGATAYEWLDTGVYQNVNVHFHATDASLELQVSKGKPSPTCLTTAPKWNRPALPGLIQLMNKGCVSSSELFRVKVPRMREGHKTFAL